MSSGERKVKIVILGDSKGGEKALKATEKASGKMGAALKVGAAAAGAALAKMGLDSIKSASNAEQAIGGINAVFGDAAKQVEAFSKTSARNLGLAGQDYNTLAALVGSQLQRMGKSQAESATETDKLIKLGADLAATYGGSVSDAVSAVGSLLKGERDPIERYGVGINEAAIKAHLLEKGLGDLTGAALDQAKGQATLELLTKQTANAQGQAAREAKTAAGQSARLGAQYKDLTASVGAKLLPVLTKLADWLQKTIDFVERNQAVLKPLVVVLGTFGAGLYVVVKAMKIYSAVAKAMAVANTIALGPVGLIIIAVAAFAAGLVILYKKSETFRNIVTAVFKFVGKAVLGAIDGILWSMQKFAEGMSKVPFIGDKFKGAAEAIQNVRGEVGKLQTKLDALGKPINIKVNFQSGARELNTIQDEKAARRATASKNRGRAASGGAAHAGDLRLVGENGPEVVRFGDRARITSNKDLRALGGGVGSVVINVNGAQDPKGVAEEVRKILLRQSARGMRVGLS